MPAPSLLMDEVSRSNPNSLWGAFLAECLVRLGVQRAVISPGSRSTPITIGLARHPGLRAVPVLDERSAAFCALGMAKASQRPVALVCTSGTATANFLPALVEASESGVPLLVLTADRPPEARSCHAAQTIDQLKLYGSYVRFFAELPVPEASPAILRHLRETLAAALRVAGGASPGPVHLNCPFRDPLPPGGEVMSLGFDPATLLPAPAEPWRRGTTSGGDAIDLPPRTLVVAGFSTAAYPRAFLVAGAPVLADMLSPWRHSGRIPGVVWAYDAVLRSPAWRERLAPEAVVQVGDLPTSKVLREWLEAWDVPHLAVLPDEGHRNPVLARFQPATVFSGARIDPAYAAEWQRASRQAEGALQDGLAVAGNLFEGLVAHHLSRWLPAQTPVFLASSMPVRDAEWFWPASDRGFLPLANRGANGIDGTLSTALGVADVWREQPSVLLTGDLALLHDANGFLFGPHFRGSLTIVCLNNHGGGIFQHLPIARAGGPFEEFWATPQEVDFAALARAHGVEHHRVQALAELEPLMRALPARGIRLVEVLCDRQRDAAFRQQLFAHLAQCLQP